MTTQAEIDQARAAGIRAAAQAQAIADAAEPSLLDRVESGAAAIYHGVTDPFTAGIQGATDAANNATQAVTHTVDEIMNVLKWVGIVVLVLVAVLAALWLGAVVFGLVWAGKVLIAVAPSFAKSLQAAAPAIARAALV